jgi:DNA-binding transcriptional LysR family regulator
LTALRAIAQEGTFVRAGARLGYTQSAISQQIASLERIVGECLLERANGRKPVGLTAAGELVLRHGEAMLARVQAAQSDLEALRDGSAGPLRVGTYPSVGIRILPELLPAFAAVWPELEVQLRESNSDTELLTLVEQGELDLAFCMLPLDEGPFEALQLLRDPWLLVVPTDSSLTATGAGVAGNASKRLPLVCFRTCPNIREIESILHSWGIEPTIVFRSDDNATLQALVGAGVGAAFMPCLTVNADDPRTVFVDVRRTLPPRLIGIVWHRDRLRSPASRAFVEAAHKVCSQLESEIEPRAFTTATWASRGRRRTLVSVG